MSFSFSKTLLSGKYGSLYVSIASGVASLSGSLAASLGGGQAQGVVSTGLSGSVSVPFKKCLDLGFEALKARLASVPAAAAAISGLQTIVDAELS